jgi:glycine C-acetyltransferase
VRAGRNLDAVLESRLESLRNAGKYKTEVVLSSTQSARVESASGTLVNFCSNNYLGFADHPAVLAGARAGLERRGAGMASVRFICGTQDEHLSLERDIADLLGYEDAILYNSAFDANVGLFEAITSAEDVILSDALNHASIIDGVRLSRARRLVYAHNSMDDLRAGLEDSSEARLRIIATDGVFSMEGELAPLGDIVALAEEYGAVVMVDDSHGVGVVGDTGRGTVEHLGVSAGVHIQTGTFGKALGGAAGGYVAGSAALVDILRQQSRPYLFSNAMPPAVVGAARAALRILREDPGPIQRLHANVAWFRTEMDASGFQIVPGEHAIVAVMVGDERRAMELAASIRAAGIMVVAFTHPVVPEGAARIRVQISAGHSRDDLAKAMEAFTTAGRRLGILP